jgi:L-asparagine transporter-like permease
MNATQHPKLADRVSASLDASALVVNDWRDAWRWLSMRAMALSGAEVAGWGALPQPWRDAVPHWVFVLVVLSTLALGMIGRVVQQAKPSIEGDTA